MSRGKGMRESIAPRDVLIPLGVGLILGIVAFTAQGGFTAVNTGDFWRAVCDALAVPGLLLTCLGLLSFVSGQGTFDGLNFSVRKAFSQILSEERRNTMPKTFYDYVNLKQERRRKKPNVLLFTGLGFLVLAGIALAVWLSVS